VTQGRAHTGASGACRGGAGVALGAVSTAVLNGL